MDTCDVCKLGEVVGGFEFEDYDVGLCEECFALVNAAIDEGGFPRAVQLVEELSERIERRRRAQLMIAQATKGVLE